jgi:hypothetical protein
LAEQTPSKAPWATVSDPDPFGVLAAAVASVRAHVEGLRRVGLSGSGLGEAVVALVGLRSQVGVDPVSWTRVCVIQAALEAA